MVYLYTVIHLDIQKYLRHFISSREKKILIQIKN